MIETGVISVELERLLVRELARTWHELNQSLFRSAMTPPVLQLVDGRDRLGRWVREERAIEISRPLVAEQSWGTVLEVLKHEVAHQFVHEVMGLVDESAHGPAFRDVCARFAIDGRAAGVPAPSGPPDERARRLDRLAKLLALAESPNRHEAEAAMAAAQRLIHRYQLELPARAGYAFRHLGEPTGRVGEPDRLRAHVLERHFLVECIWVPVWRVREGRRGSVLEVCGTPDNLELAAYVHAFLGDTAERLWRDYKRARGLRGDGERRRFLAGVMAGFDEKLEAGRRAVQREGLVWVRDKDLASWYRKRHPYIRWTRHTGGGDGEARRDGQAAGREIVLHRPIKQGGGGGGPRGLLGS
jgi:hypothetical protein